MVKDRIKECRKSLKVSQSKFGEMCGVGQVTVFQWEKGIGYPSGFRLITLSKLLGTTKAQLVDDIKAEKLLKFGSK